MKTALITGINGHLHKDNIYYLWVYKQSDIRYIKDKFYKNNGFSLTRKRLKFEEIKNG